MAQLRPKYQEFLERGAEIVVAGPEGATEFQDYWKEKDLPFIGIPDPTHVILDRYGQEFKLLKMGRMPAQFVIDKQGMVRFVNYGDVMWDIASDEEILAILDELNQEQNLERELRNSG